jgi:hypothetical protein
MSSDESPSEGSPSEASPPPGASPPEASPPVASPPPEVSPSEGSPPEASPPSEAPPAEAPPPAAPPPDSLLRDDELHDEPPPRGRSTGPLRLLAFAVMLGGLILVVAGAFTWYVVRDQLSDEKITVSDDADNFAGDPVDGPLTAYAQADVINEHALEETDGLTYAQLDQDDPRRETVMTASFLRASLFTSVVSFGVAAFAFGLGLLLLLIGWALLRIERSLRAMTT